MKSIFLEKVRLLLLNIGLRAAQGFVVRISVGILNEVIRDFP